ncbi:MAG: GNAT family N-acetyltransferase [Rhodobacteraceae bacterium]|nr:GNAT family N-acetyltransferase [Paracoccaceae bacterium]
MTEAKAKGTIRPLTSDDLEPVIAIDKANAGTSRRGFFEKRLAAALASPGDYVYVGLEDGGKLVGYAMARLIEGEFGSNRKLAHLDAIAVEAGYQHHGAGHRLLDAVKAVLKRKEIEAFECQVDWADRALLGFLGDTGFALAPALVLARSTEELSTYSDADLVEDESDLETDFSSPEGDTAAALSHDRIPVRSMTAEDLAPMIRIDRKRSGRDRTAYYERKQAEALNEAGVRVSLVAEMDGYPVGFIMARVDFGEFGHTIREAVMDTMAVDPGYQGQGVGRALMNQLVSNLSVLRVETVRTEAAWNANDLIAFFDASGFRPSQRVALTCAI